MLVGSVLDPESETTEVDGSHPTAWQLGRDRSIDLSTPCVMGILNATPDSFHDGRSDFMNTEHLLEHGLSMLREGACIIDVGGESTRPGSNRVDSLEQCRRTTPLIRELAIRDSALLSIDTTHARVAEAALDAGAVIVNDVSGGTEDPALLSLVAERGCGIVLMHRLAPPGSDVYSDQYRSDPDYGTGGVVSAVQESLQVRMEAALSAGIEPAQVLLDPGLGFGKSVEQNLELIRGLSQLRSNLGRPLLVGASRKSFIGALLGGRPPSERLFGSLVVAVRAVEAGASVIRTHDVGSTIDSLEVARAIGRT